MTTTTVDDIHKLIVQLRLGVKSGQISHITSQLKKGEKSRLILDVRLVCDGDVQEIPVVKCPQCEGTRIHNNRICKNCDGDGWIAQDEYEYKGNQVKFAINLP